MRSFFDQQKTGLLLCFQISRSNFITAVAKKLFCFTFYKPIVSNFLVTFFLQSPQFYPLLHDLPYPSQLDILVLQYLQSSQDVSSPSVIVQQKAQLHPMIYKLLQQYQLHVCTVHLPQLSPIITATYTTYIPFKAY